jgi:phenylalanyl-tRNA synthetase beta chain
MAFRVPLSWLREYVDISVAPEELARRLTLAGIEVEHIVSIGAEWENIYTGRVARLEKHPNADKLMLATVEYGAENAITVVTGAPNIEEGQAVVLGLIGARYLDQHVSPAKWSTLKPAKIRGIQTEGMVMSEAELGLSEEHEGIIVLDPQIPLGLPARDVLGETILEIDVSPNNGRILSMIGLAREVAALFGGEVRYPSTDWVAAGPAAESLLAVEIEDTDLCARYSGAVIAEVRVEPSPAWMQRRLTQAGMRPINNIVDITNYVMLEMGQPLHAFSYDAVEGHKIVVRRARPGERIVTLDHVERELDPNMLAICDVNRPVALAGVMGGAESEISEVSNNVLLESAHFNSLSVRRTARLLKLPSEASYRFERFVDPNLTIPAMVRAAELMRQLAGGVIAEGYVDAYPVPYKPRQLIFYTSEVERLLGIKVPPSEVAEMLRRLDFTVNLPHNADVVGQDTTMLVDIPSYRNDVTLSCDLVEEVARMIGYDRIPETLIEGGLPPQEVNHSRETEERMRDLMAACGMDEVICYSVTHSEWLAKLASREQGAQSTDNGAERPAYRSWDTSRPPVTIVNPMSSKEDVMRPTLLPNMLQTLRANLRAMPESPVQIFELGKIYVTRTQAEVEERLAEMERELEKYPRLLAWEHVENEERLPLEPRRLVGMISGPRYPRSLFSPDSQASEAQLDFFDAKGVVEEMLRHLHVQAEWLPVDAPLFHPGRAAMLRAQDVDLGVVGELHPSVLEEWEIPAQRVGAWDLDVEAILKVMPERAIYQAVSAYQPVRQDMAFVAGNTVPASTLARAIKKAGGASIADVSLFDVYTGQSIPEGHRSLAFAVTFSSPDKALTEEEVARLRKRIESMLERELGAKLRT